MKKIFIFLLIIFIGVALTRAVSYQKQKVTVPLRFDYYYTYEMVIDALKALHKAYLP